MRKIVWMLGCAMLFALGSLPARAQIEGEAARTWDMRAGFFLPERGIARAAEGDVWFTFGLDKEFYYADRYTGVVTVDYYGSGKVYSVPIMVNLRAKTQRLRYGAGFGVAMAHDLTRGQTAVCCNLLLGYEITQDRNPLIADLRYLSTQMDGGVLNGWAFTLGGRF